MTDIGTHPEPRIRARQAPQGSNGLSAPDLGLDVSIVMPCLNEEEAVQACVETALASIAATGMTGEVLVVDNNSTDRSAELARAAGARVVVDPYQAYLQVLAPVGNGINIFAGRFVTLAGYEVIEAWKDPNITRSILFGFAIPFTHTGIRTNYTAGPITFTAGLNNGWDQVEELNDSPTIESQLAYSYAGTTVSSAWLGVTGYFGKEPSGLGFGGEGWRELITAVGTITFVEKITLIVDADFGWQQDVVFDELGNDDNVSWWGIAGYIVVDPHPAVRLALRGEYFDDPEGYRTGLDQKLFEFTPTLILKPFKGLIAGNKFLDNFEARAEFRWDHSDENFFVTEDDGLKKDQYGVMGQLLYWIQL